MVSSGTDKLGRLYEPDGVAVTYMILGSAQSGYVPLVINPIDEGKWLHQQYSSIQQGVIC